LPGRQHSASRQSAVKIPENFFRWRLAAESRYAITYEAGAGEKTGETVSQKIFDELSGP